MQEFTNRVASAWFEHSKPGYLYKVNSTQKTTCDFEVEISETSLCPKRPVFFMVAGADGI